MARERSLLERLGRFDERPLTGGQNIEDLASSVLSHLQKMLNTRQGHVLIQPEYGLPDMTQFVSDLPEMARTSSRAIKNSIERFEPRLRNVTVTHVPNDEDVTNLWFKIMAELVTDREEVTVSFQTRVNPSGHIEVME
jgi:type VI secretion system protein